MPVTRKRRHRRRGFQAWVFFPFFLVLMLATRLPFLSVPFFWDELGQFVPAALDLYQHGWLIPRTATPNVHPPGLSFYLASLWSVAGFSIPATRVAMLLLASLAVFTVFLLAIEYCRDVKGLPALLVPLLLAVSPLFVSQSILAQLDMPAMLFTSLALLLFLRERLLASAVASVALIFFKETGVLVPLCFAAVLAVERRWRAAVLFLAPVAVLSGWMLGLHAGTGHYLGNAGFADYNLLYLAHPVRAAFALGKRLYTLFFENFHWVGTLGILFGCFSHGRLYSDRRWRIAIVLIAVHVAAFSLLGGAMLERYLLPVFPLLYCAMVAGWSSTPGPARTLGLFALLAGVALANLWNPPYPFPYENNLAFTDFVRLHQDAAAWLEERQPNARVTTVWPLTAALSRPEFGYVHSPRLVDEIPDFSVETLGRLDPARSHLIVLYSREWNPPGSLLRFPDIEKIWRRFFDYRPQASGADLEATLHMKVVRAWSLHGQWVQIYVAHPPPLTPP